MQVIQASIYFSRMQQIIEASDFGYSLLAVKNKCGIKFAGKKKANLIKIKRMWEMGTFLHVHTGKI